MLCVLLQSHLLRGMSSWRYYDGDLPSCSLGFEEVLVHKGQRRAPSCSIRYEFLRTRKFQFKHHSRQRCTKMRTDARHAPLPSSRFCPFAPIPLINSNPSRVPYLRLLGVSCRYFLLLQCVSVPCHFGTRPLSLLYPPLTNSIPALFSPVPASLYLGTCTSPV